MEHHHQPEAGPESARVCAIIVHHRGRRLLARCLDTLLASTGIELQVVIVANACHEKLPAVAAADERIHTVTSARSIGFSAANNLGAGWARRHLVSADYLFFVNNDTVIEPQTLARLVAGMTALDECAIAGPRLLIWGAHDVLNSLGLKVTIDGEAWDEGIGRPLSEYADRAGSTPVLAVTGAALMVRRERFETLGGWEDLYGFYFEDIDLCLRARSHGWDVAVVHDAVMRHAISATAARGSDMKRQLSWRNRFLLMTIHWPWRLLLRVGPRAVAGELRLAVRRARARAWGDLRIQIRSWLGAVRRWPRALASRSRLGGHRDWADWLEPSGSVPRIQLPELPAEAAEVAPAGQRKG